MTITVDPALRLLMRVASGVAMEWSTPSNMPNRHEMRVSRLRSTWPSLARALDSLTESIPDGDVDVSTGALCPNCGAPATRIKAAPDPRTAVKVHRVEPCGHEIDADAAIALWGEGTPIDDTPVDGATLIGAEVHRQRETGRTRARDEEQHDAGELAWAAWCYLDQAARDARRTNDVPSMWPFAPSSWSPQKSRTRSLIVAGALIAAELDRALAQGETP